MDKPGLEAWALHGNGLRIAQAEHVQREYQLRQVKEAGHFGGLIADTSYDHAAKTKGLRRDKGPLGHQRGVRDGDGEELRIVQYVLIGRVEELVVPVQIAAEQEHQRGVDQPLLPAGELHQGGPLLFVFHLNDGIGLKIAGGRRPLRAVQNGVHHLLGDRLVLILADRAVSEQKIDGFVMDHSDVPFWEIFRLVFLCGRIRTFGRV